MDGHVVKYVEGKGYKTNETPHDLHISLNMWDRTDERRKRNSSGYPLTNRNSATLFIAQFCAVFGAQAHDFHVPDTRYANNLRTTS